MITYNFAMVTYDNLSIYSGDIWHLIILGNELYWKTYWWYYQNGNVYAEDDDVTHGQVSPVERMDHKGLIPKVDDTGNL